MSIELASLADIYDRPLVILDRDHRVILINRAFEMTYGVSRSRAVGSPCHALAHGANGPYPCDHPGTDCPFSRVLRRGVAETLTHQYRDRDGQEHQVQIKACPVLGGNGQLLLGAVIEEDVLRRPAFHASDGGTEHMVGEAPAFREALDQLRRVAASDAPVLLQGETGTGKELAARFLHAHSTRRSGPFLTLDCAALTEGLFESEVFGHERGSFTGSLGDKGGLFELADKGTLFLDEIGELPSALQAKLLRVLESGEFRRVGSLKTRRADVRLVCATNRELRDQGGFRRDLYFRIACVRIRLPSLSERRSDIPLLAAELTARISASTGRQFQVDDSALALLQGYDYPGNVRELRNILWVAALGSAGGTISAREVEVALPARPGADSSPASLPDVGCLGGLGGEIRVRLPPARVWEAQHLASILRRHNGNRRAVARELGVSERTVYRKIKRLGLN